MVKMAFSWCNEIRNLESDNLIIGESYVNLMLFLLRLKNLFEKVAIEVFSLVFYINIFLHIRKIHTLIIVF